jgi:hypothetical protein
MSHYDILFILVIVTLLYVDVIWNMMVLMISSIFYKISNKFKGDNHVD